MERLLSCEFNMDTACVEVKFADDSMIAINTIDAENEIADNMYQRSDLDWLIYNKPLYYSSSQPGVSRRQSVSNVVENLLDGIWLGVLDISIAHENGVCRMWFNPHCRVDNNLLFASSSSCGNSTISSDFAA